MRSNSLRESLPFQVILFFGLSLVSWVIAIIIIAATSPARFAGRAIHAKPQP